MQSLEIKFRYALAATLVGLLCSYATAYVIDTHARITINAYNNSTAATEDKLRSLGIYKSRAQNSTGADRFLLSLGTQYFDLSGGVAKPRFAATYDALNTAAMKRGASALVQRWIYSTFNGVSIPYFPGDWMARCGTRR